MIDIWQLKAWQRGLHGEMSFSWMCDTCTTFGRRRAAGWKARDIIRINYVINKLSVMHFN